MLIYLYAYIFICLYTYVTDSLISYRSRRDAVEKDGGRPAVSRQPDTTKVTAISVFIITVMFIMYYALLLLL